MPATAIRVTVDPADLAARMRDRLRGPGAAPPPARIVWQQGRQRLLIHLDSLALRALAGWLLVSLDLQTDQTGRQSIQIVYHLGRPDEGDGLNAAATMNTTTLPAAQLAERWGDDLHRVLWDAVLDLIEVSLQLAGAERRSEPLTLQGYGCADNLIFVDVVTGAH